MIATAHPIPTLEEYDRMADEYQATLTLENYMENSDQARQREIALASFALVKDRRPEVQYFNEMLILYPLEDGGTGKVVPDNMVIVQAEPVESKKSFNTLREKAGVLLVMEYVSEGNARKDYVDNFAKYRDGVGATYYLLFDPAKQVLQVHHLVDGEYVKLEPDVRGRVAIPELDIEVAILDRWTRFWYGGKLLLLPAQLQAELDTATARLKTVTGERDEERRRRLEIEVDRDGERKLRVQLEVELQRVKDELAKRVP